jgi:phospholipase C
MNRAAGLKIGVSLLVVGGLASFASSPARAASRTTANTATPVQQIAATPIQHVVVVLQENHSFDNVLGVWCVQTGRCDGATSGRVSNGSTQRLSVATDIVVPARHNSAAQTAAIDGGAMDGFNNNDLCTKAQGYPCYTQYRPKQIPNVIALASKYVVSDRSFELDGIPSFGAHMDLAAGTLDGFTGDQPDLRKGVPPAEPGWGCNSDKDVLWQPNVATPLKLEPSCVPAADGSGPYRPSPVAHVPTIMDRLDAARLSWQIYSPAPAYAICPTFADCLYTTQSKNYVKDDDSMLHEAAAGTMPAVTFLMPKVSNSQHNSRSMMQGDNWIAQVVNAIASGPDWSSTAIFITWDDCGCFYDHVPPPNPTLGVRVPMVIVSPYGKRAYTDSTVATSTTSVLAFIEHNWRLAPLVDADRSGYDYMDAFDFAAPPALARPQLSMHPIPRSEQAWIAAHPGDADDDGT